MKKTMLIFAGLLIASFSISQAKYVDYESIPSWAEVSVEMVEDANIMTGFGDGTFQPNKSINRSEAIVLIFRTKGISPEDVVTTSLNASFPDVPKGSWFEKSVVYGKKKGWIKGFPDGNFHPEKELNKAEFMVLLQRVYELESNPDNIPRFSDVPEKTWFTDAVLALYNNDLIRHGRAYKFFPEQKVSRAESAWIFAQILQKPRLMGTSSSNEFDSGGRLSSRRVAVRKKDLDVNQQGYDIEKSAIYVNVYDKIENAEMMIGSDWIEMGDASIENKLEDKVTLDDISFKIIFDTGVGPARNFMLKMVNERNETEQFDFPRSGTLFIPNWKKDIQPGESYDFRVFVKPMEVTGYYPKKGIGTLYLSDLSATAVASFQGENATSGRLNYKQAPIEYKSRNFRDVNFTPTVEQ